MDADGDGIDDGGGHGFGGHSSHDAYGNQDHAGSGQATWDAIAIGHSHSDAAGHWGSGSVHCGNSQSGAAHEYHSHAEGGRGHAQHDPARCDVPPAFASGTERRMYAAHVVGHGWVDLLNEFARIAHQYDVIRIDPYRPSMSSDDNTIAELADDEPWNPPYNPDKTPTPGWYPGATGTTRIIRQVWQVGKRDGLFDQGLVYALRKLRKHEWYKDPVYDKDAKTYLEVGVVIWHYKETADYETLVTVRIVSTKIWHPILGVYGYKKTPFLEHQKAAEEIIKEVLEVLKKAEPSEASRILRRDRMSADHKSPTHPKPGPTPGPTPNPGPTPDPPAPHPNCPVVGDADVAGSGVDLSGMLDAEPAQQPPAVKPLRKLSFELTVPV